MTLALLAGLLLALLGIVLLLAHLLLPLLGLFLLLAHLLLALLGLFLLLTHLLLASLFLTLFHGLPLGSSNLFRFTLPFLRLPLLGHFFLSTIQGFLLRLPCLFGGALGRLLLFLPLSSLLALGFHGFLLGLTPCF